MFIAPGEVQRRHTRDPYSCTQAFVVYLRETSPSPSPRTRRGDWILASPNWRCHRHVADCVLDGVLFVSSRPESVERRDPGFRPRRTGTSLDEETDASDSSL